MSGLKRVPVVRTPSWERDAANAVNFMLRHTEPLNRTANALDIADTVNLAPGKVYEIDGTQVVGPRDTGWSADTGTADKSAHATYTSPTISNPPTQAEVQAISDALQAATQQIKALKDALILHGLLGA